MSKFSVVSFLFLGGLLPGALPVFAQESVDLAAMDRIKTEAFDRSKVMDHLYQMTDARGPRLTGSPEFEQAAQWAVGRLKEYGLQNPHLEHWGPFGRSWSLQQASVEMLEPRYLMLDAVPLAWSSATSGPVSGDLVIAPFKASLRDGPKKVQEDLKAWEAKWTGQLKGKIVLLQRPKAPSPKSSVQFQRYTDAELADIGKAPLPAVKATETKLEDLDWPEDPAEVGKVVGSLSDTLYNQFIDLSNAISAERGAFLAREGAAGVLIEDARANTGMLFAEAAGAFRANGTLAPPTFVITAEQYDRIARSVEKKAPVKLRLNLAAKVGITDVDGLNIIGEIPGTNPAKKDEIVMIGAHFDSWHAGTGATDNAAGSAVMIEVMRILKTLNLKLDRTVRIALWSGEEQGLYGSRAYVKEHFGDPASMKLTAEHAKLAAYFNLDNGSGKIRGVYLQGNEAARRPLEQWLAPFRDLGVTTTSIRNTGGTDHLSFVAVGLPGFQFIQDPLDYSTITHHSSMDTYDHVIAEDLMQASAVIAGVVYDAANAKDMLPRRDVSSH